MIKRILITCLPCLFFIAAKAQFSIRKNTSNSTAVDILYTPPASGTGTLAVQYFEFALQVPNPQGSTLTATWTPAAPLASISAFQASTGVDYGNTTFAWASSGVPNYSATYSFSSSEVVLGTVSFSPASAAQGAIVSAIDYSNNPTYGGPGTQAAVWTMQVGSTGTDVTNYSNLFYQSAASGTTSGSASPSTTNDGGATNQIITLSATPLPILLTTFSGYFDNNCKPVLYWEITNALSIDHFELEYSADGKYFSLVKEIMKTDAENYMVSLSGDDGKPGFFRLKMSGTDGSTRYSNIVDLHNCGAFSNNAWSLFPNPVSRKDQVTVLLNANQKLEGTLKISNAVGQTAGLLHKSVLVGENKYNLDLSEYSPGVYYIHFLSNEHTGLKPLKLIIQ